MKKIKELGQLHNIYCNDYGIKCYEQEDGSIYLQKYKLFERVNYHNATISRESYELLKDREDEYQCVIEMLEYLCPVSSIVYQSESSWS